MSTTTKLQKIVKNIMTQAQYNDLRSQGLIDANQEYYLTDASSSDNHAELTNLGYSASGHTGFQASLTAGAGVQINNDIISADVQFKAQVVEELPTTGQEGILYLVAKTETTDDAYNEYIWVIIDSVGQYEFIGTTDIDLTDYVKNTAIGTLSSLTTTAKTDLVTAINEVNTTAGSVSARSVYDKTAAITNGTITLDDGTIFYTDSPSGATTYTINSTALTQTGFTYRYFNVLITMLSTAVGLDFTTNNNLVWAENETPDMTTGGRTYLLAFQTFDGGTTWIGSLCTWWTTPIP